MHRMAPAHSGCGWPTRQAQHISTMTRRRCLPRPPQHCSRRPATAHSAGPRTHLPTPAGLLHSQVVDLQLVRRLVHRKIHQQNVVSRRHCACAARCCYCCRGPTAPRRNLSRCVLVEAKQLIQTHQVGFGAVCGAGRAQQPRPPTPGGNFVASHSRHTFAAWQSLHKRGHHLHHYHKHGNVATQLVIAPPNPPHDPCRQTIGIVGRDTPETIWCFWGPNLAPRR